MTARPERPQCSGWPEGNPNQEIAEADRWRPGCLTQFLALSVSANELSTTFANCEVGWRRTKSACQKMSGIPLPSGLHRPTHDGFSVRRTASGRRRQLMNPCPVILTISADPGCLVFSRGSASSCRFSRCSKVGFLLSEDLSLGRLPRNAAQSHAI